MSQNHLISRFARAVTTYEKEALVQDHVAEALVNAFGEQFHTLAPTLLEVGCGTGLLTRRLMARFSPQNLYLNDICPDMAICFANLPRTTFLPGDISNIEMPYELDAIISSSAIQWIPNLSAFIQQCVNHLNPTGLIAFSTFGPDTLTEIRELTGVGLNYLKQDQFYTICNQHFMPLVTKSWHETLYFKTPLDVLRHLKATGVTATNTDSSIWTRGKIEAFEQRYQATFTTTRGVSLTYEPIIYIGKCQ